MKFIKGLMPGKRLEADPEFEEEAEDHVLESEFDRILKQKQQGSDQAEDWDEDWDDNDEDWDDAEDEDDFAEAPVTPVRPRRPVAASPTATTGSGEVDLAALNNLLNSDRADSAPATARNLVDDDDDFDDDDFDDDDGEDDDDGWDDLDFEEDEFDDDISEEPDPAPTRAGGRKIWDLEGVSDDDDFDDPDENAEDLRPAAEIVDVSAAAALPTRAAGRVKTRLLGFQPAGVTPDVFGDGAASNANGPTMYPVGWIVVIAGPGRGACFTLMSGVSQIGRGEDMTIKLDFGDTSISRQNHAAVAFDQELNQFFLGHGGKSNLVRLNDKPVLSTEALSDGDLIRIGETTLRFVALCGDGFTWHEDDGEDLNYAAAT